MDVTHVPEFGRLKYLHVTVDTYSHFAWATPQTGEKAIHIIRHLTSCFAVMGVPQKLKTDNGSAYTSEKMRKFCQMWGVVHTTGIPYSPTGRGIVERSNQTIKRYLQKFRDARDIQERVSKTLFIMNYLCIFGDSEVVPAKCHSGVPSTGKPCGMKVYYRDLSTGKWEGPAEVQFIGKGYMCVLTPSGPQWIPARWTKAVLDSQPPRSSEDKESA